MNLKRLRRVARNLHGCRHGAVSFVPRMGNPGRDVLPRRSDPCPVHGRTSGLDGKTRMTEMTVGLRRGGISGRVAAFEGRFGRSCQESRSQRLTAPESAIRDGRRDGQRVGDHEARPHALGDRGENGEEVRDRWGDGARRGCHFRGFSGKCGPARQGRNPRTGELLATGLWNAVPFGAGIALKDGSN